MDTSARNTKLLEWLQFAFEEPVDRLNECYYFDRNNNEFFSVFITDYILTAGDGEITEMPYSPEELATLKERLDRLEINDPDILMVRRLSSEERKEMMHDFLSFSGNQQPHLTKQIELTSGKSILDWNGQLSENLMFRWNEYKRAIIFEKIILFCLEEGIDLNSATRWTDKKLTTLTFDLTDKKEKNPTLPQKKPWWRFW